MPDLLRRIFRPRRPALVRAVPVVRPILPAAETSARNYARMHSAAMARERRFVDGR